MGNQHNLIPITHNYSYNPDSLVIITGASSGLGRQIALVYASRKARLLLTARNIKRLEQVRDECLSRGARQVQIFCCDISKQSDVAQLHRFFKAKHNKLDILVLNAGINAHFIFEKLSPEKISVVEQLLKTNYMANVYLTKYFLPELRAAHGQIILISSMSGRFGLPARSAYCASKFAVTGFFEALRTQNIGVAITIVYPPSIETPMRDHDILKQQNFKSGSDQHQEEGKREDPRKCAQMLVRAADYRVENYYFPLKAYVANYLYPFSSLIREKVNKAARL